MASSYPGALDTFTNPVGTDYQDTVDHATQHTNANDAIAAVQTELGINPAGNYTDVVDRLNDYDTIGWTAAQLGYLGWNYDVQYIQAGTALSANGTVYVAKCWTPVALSVTNLHVQVITAGATLTASQNLAALYDGSKNLVGTTGDQSTAWTSVGTKTMALTGGPFAISANTFYYVAYFANGTTRPSFGRLGSNLGGMNGLLSAANSRFASSSTGRTTSMPATLGAFTATNLAYWVAVS